jgi:hypothetical protein
MPSSLPHHRHSWQVEFLSGICRLVKDSKQTLERCPGISDYAHVMCFHQHGIALKIAGDNLCIQKAGTKQQLINRRHPGPDPGSLSYLQ